MSYYDIWITYFWLTFAVSLIAINQIPATNPWYYEVVGMVLLSLLGFIAWPLFVYVAYQWHTAPAAVKASMIAEWEEDSVD